MQPHVRRRIRVLGTAAAVFVAFLVGYTLYATNPYQMADGFGQLSGGFFYAYSEEANQNDPGGLNARGFSGPYAVAVDEVHHRAFVADSDNNRVLVFNLNNDNTAPDHTADFVLGQPGFTSNAADLTEDSLSSPAALAYDPVNDRLFVGEADNNRVTVFDTATITNGEAAVNIIGAPDFESYGNGPSPSEFSEYVSGLAYDGVNERLFVSDYYANRVMVFDVDPAVLVPNDTDTNGPDAINVIGQFDYDDSGYGLASGSLNNPAGLAYDDVNERLFVNDSNAFRVMVFDVDPSVLVPGELPDSPLSNTVNVEISSAGGWIDDDFPVDETGAYLERPPVSPGSGQGGLKSNPVGHFKFAGSACNGGTTPANTKLTGGPSVACVYSTVTGRKYQLDISDWGVDGIPSDDPNTVYDRSEWSDTAFKAVNVIGVPDMTAEASEVPSISDFAGLEAGIVYDNETDRLFVTDTAAHRILVFDADPSVLIPDDGATNGPDALNVLGQADFDSASPDTSVTGLSSPQGLSYIASGSVKYLFAADTGNNRVMIFDATDPVGDGDAAVEGLGHPDYSDVMDFDVSGSNNSDYPPSGPQAENLNSPQGVAVDEVNHRVYVADAGNNRVLVHNLETDQSVDDRSADFVLGQPDFISDDSATTRTGLNSPTDVAVDVVGERLFVADNGNNRVLVYDVSALSNGASAAHVLGQPDFTTADDGLDEFSMSNPHGLTYSATGLLYVVDNSNNRVLVYDVGSSIDDTVDGQAAEHVLGQDSFAANASATTVDGLSNPERAVLDESGNRLFVADKDNNRVVVFDITTIDDGEDAIAVIGQADFTTADPVTSVDGLSAPYGLAYDADMDYLFVGDTSSFRVTVYDTALLASASEDAVAVLGQSDFDAANDPSGVPDPTTIRSPWGLAFDGTARRLYVADQGHHRVSMLDLVRLDDAAFPSTAIGVEYFESFTLTGEQSSVEITIASGSLPPGMEVSGDSIQGEATSSGVYTFTARAEDTDGWGALAHEETFTITVAVGTAAYEGETVYGSTNGEDAYFLNGDAYNLPNSFSIGQPVGTELDPVGHRLFVTDAGNNRVLVYNLEDDNTLTDHDADYVLGQPDFRSSGSGLSANEFTMIEPPVAGIAWDGSQYLFVADLGNSRVMVFDLSGGITNGMNAAYVIGQSSFTSNLDVVTAAGMSMPTGLAYDEAADRLFVADSTASRVLIYDLSGGITTGMAASVVLGQPNFTSGSSATTQAGMGNPDGLAYDPATQRLFVADRGNNRVLVHDVTAPTNGQPADAVLGQALFTTNGTGVEYWESVFAGTSSYLPSSFARDTDADVLYIGMNSGEIFRCPVSSGCDETADWTEAMAFFSQVYGLVYVPSGVGEPALYATNGFSGALYRCETSTGCDDSGDWILVSGSFPSAFFLMGLTVDTVHDVLYMVTGTDGIIFRCDLTTDCDALGDWTVSYDTSSTIIQSAHFDAAGGVLYMGDTSGAKIFLCDTATDCDASGDWTDVTLAGFNIEQIATDEANGVTYATTGFPDLYRCETSTGCDTVGEWTISYDGDGTEGDLRAVVWDSVQDAMYLSRYDSDTNDFDVYRCETSTGCDATEDWTLSRALGGGQIYDLYFDAEDNALYGTGYDNNTEGRLLRCIASTGCPSGTGMDAPTGLAYDGADQRLFVSESGFNRVTVFDADSISNGENPVAVLGQADFDTTDAVTTQAGLDTPDDLTYDADSGLLYVADKGNRRVMVFAADAVSNGEPATDLIGQNAADGTPYWEVNGSGPNDRGFDFDPTTGGCMALDTVHHRLFVCSGKRVHVLNLDGDNVPLDGIADAVLGAPNFFEEYSGTTAYSWSESSDLAYDSENDRLFVADYNENRVLVFDVSTIANGESAVNVLGQDDFTSSVFSGAIDGLAQPGAIALDETTQRLFVLVAGDPGSIKVFDVDPAVLVSGDTGTDGPDAINEVVGDTDAEIDSFWFSNGVEEYAGAVVDSERQLLFLNDGAHARILIIPIDEATLVPGVTDTITAIGLIGHDSFDDNQNDDDEPLRYSVGYGGGELAYDDETKTLFVADPDYRRITAFDVATPTVMGPDAAFVLGQEDFTSDGNGQTPQERSDEPYDLAIDTTTRRLLATRKESHSIIAYDLVRMAEGEFTGLEVGEPFSSDIITFNDQGSLTFELIDGELPPGLVLGSLSGTPTQDGTFTFTVQANDDNGAIGTLYDQQTFTVTVGGGGSNQTGSFIILPGATVTPTPTPVPATPIPTPLYTPDPAGAVTLAGGAPTTTSRYVRVDYDSPFADNTGVSMRTVNAGTLTANDRDVIYLQRFGPAKALTDGTVNAPVETRVELQAGLLRSFAPTVSSWDLCAGAPDCPEGTYTVYAQYIKPAGSPASLGALGDIISDVYSDSISYALPTPTPTPVPPTPAPPVPPAPPAAPAGPVAPAPGAPSGPGPAPAGPAAPGAPAPGAPTAPPGPSVVSAAAGAAGAAAEPVAAASTAVAVLAVLLAAVNFARTGVSMFNVLGFALQTGWEVVGLKKKSKVWGTIYDARTKHGIPFAKAELLDTANRVLEVRYADRDGRYGFLANPKGLHDQRLVVRIKPSVSGYRFPSTGVDASVTDFIVYDHIYTGGDLTVTGDALVNANVPMDPDPVSGKHTEYFPFVPAGHAVAGGLNLMFWVGLVAAPVAYLMHPTRANLAILAAFLVFNGIRAAADFYRPFGYVRDESTGKPMPYALVELTDPSGKRITFSVSDEQGRYFLVVAAGTYVLQLHTPANITPVRQKSVAVTARRGWISRSLSI